MKIKKYHAGRSGWFAGILVLIGGMFLSTASWASNDCLRGPLTSEADLITPFGPGIGVAEAMIGDETIVIFTHADVVASKVGEDGTIHLELIENDSTPDGSTVQLKDNVVLSPTEIPGEYRLNVRSVVLGGTGIFQDVDGKYVGHGTFSFNTLHLSHTGDARFCGLNL